MKKNMVYFVLYVVLITELLIVITERDELEEKEHEVRDKMLATIAESYKKPVLLSIPQAESDYNINNEEPHSIVMTPLGLVSDEEKQNVSYTINVVGNSTPRNWPSGGLTNESVNDAFQIELNQDGSAIFKAEFSSTGTYTFEAYFSVERELPQYLPDYLLEELEHMIGTQKEAKSEAAQFQVKTTSGGVQKKQEEIFF